MIAVLCAILTGAAFYVSTGLGEVWLAAWIAPVPVLWFAFGRCRASAIFAAAFAGHALGGANLIPAYADVLPAPVIVLAILGPAALFGTAVLGAARAFERLGALAGMVAFAALWAGVDFALSFDPSGAGALTPAASQVAAPALIQSASLAGVAGVTFLLGAVSAAIAAAICKTSARLAFLAATLFASNAGLGVWRMNAQDETQMRVALLAGDDAVGEVWKNDETAALKAINTYTEEADRLSHTGVDLIVMPENIARLDPTWRDHALAPLARAATATGATIVAGFNTETAGKPHNLAAVFSPGRAAQFYAKRRLVPGLETTRYAPGEGPLILTDGTMVAICKDLDFSEMIRRDIARARAAAAEYGGNDSGRCADQAGAPCAARVSLIAAPAWDFRKDGWSHARVAILRGVENGVAIARAARDGELTLSDRFGRLVARKASSGSVEIVTADVALGDGAQSTVYGRSGDAFGWLCLAFGLAVWTLAALRRTSDER